MTWLRIVYCTIQKEPKLNNATKPVASSCKQ